MKQLLYLVLITGTLLTSCKHDNAENNKEEKISPEIVNNPATASESGNDKKNIPQFKFESDNHEFGEIKQGEKVTYSFKFKNTGNAPLVISSATASCGCTVPEYSKTPVEAGDDGFVKVTFNSEGKSGMVSKTITLIANTIPNSKVLTISADIQVPK